MDVVSLHPNVVSRYNHLFLRVWMPSHNGITLNSLYTLYVDLFWNKRRPHDNYISNLDRVMKIPFVKQNKIVMSL